MTEKIGLEAVLDISSFLKSAGKYEKELDSLEKLTSDFTKQKFEAPEIEAPEMPEMPSGIGLPSVGGAGIGAAAATGIGAVAVAGAAATVAVGAVGAEMVSLSQDVDAAQRNIQNSLGVTGDEANALLQEAKDIFATGMVGSVNEASQAVIETQKQIGNLNNVDVGKAAKSAIKLEKAFGADFQQSLNATSVLMEEFGLTQEEAFDFLASGFQKGLDNSGDFLDSVREYGNLFGEGDASAGQFFSLLETGLQGGVLGTDKAADAFKEFQIRFAEGNDTLKEGLSEIGLDYDTLKEQIDSGSITMIDAFGQVAEKASTIDTVEGQASLAKLGTQFEDLGVGAVGAIDLAQTSLDDMAGAVDAIQPQSLGEAFGALGNQILLALEPISGNILDIFNNDVLPAISGLVEQALPYITEFAEGLTPIITQFAEELFPTLQGAFLIASENASKLAEAFGYTSENGGAMQAALDAISVILDGVIVAIEAASIVAWAWGEGLEFGLGIMRRFLTPFRQVYNLFIDIREAIEEALQALRDFISESTGNIGTTVSGISSNASIIGSSLFSNPGATATAIGNALGLGFWSKGGTVPGPVGMPQLAIVHGGETIYPPGQAPSQNNNSNVTINMNGMQFSSNGGGIDEALQEAFGMIRQQINQAGI